MMNQLTNDLEVLAGLRERGDLTNEEFARAKAALLNNSAPGIGPVSTSTTSTAKIERQNEIAQLDREWLLEREKYLSTCKHGTKQVPDKSSGIGVVLFMAVFVAIWTFVAAANGAPFIFPLFGIAVIVFLIVSCVKGYEQAEAYEAAKKRYESHRAQLTQENPNSSDE